MKLSRDWLSDYVPLDDVSDAELVDLLTTRVAEVEHYKKRGMALASGVVCEVVSVSPHPTRKKLQVCRVATGSGEVDVVCGAPNVRAGMKTAYLAPGAQLETESGESIKISARDFDGVTSVGILVSEAELGVTADHSGVLCFDDEQSVSVGDKLSDILGGPDTIIEIDNKSVTHRPDLWSHFGFARELSASLGRKLLQNPDVWADNTAEGRKLLDALGSGASQFRIKIERSSQARRFSGIEIQNVHVQPSPFWMRRRLYSVGAGVRNLLVDLSNYVMHDIGQPNHAYDADRLNGKVISVRAAHAEEAFQGLDGETRTLTVEDVVIADKQGPVALGGVMGGALSAIQPETSRLFLESANFDPIRIRKTTKRLGLRTDASNRFEKSQSAYSVPLAIQRFVELLCAIQPDAKVVGAVTEEFPEKPENITISSSFSYIRSRLGVSLSEDVMRAILSGLRFGIINEKKNGDFQAHVPYYRATRDISIPDDLVEEVGRTHGYEKVPESAPHIESTASKIDPIKRFEYRVCDLLRGAGFSETSGYSFMNEERAQSLGYPADHAVRLLNPPDTNEAVMRTSLLPGLVDTFGRNAARVEGILLFELGRIYADQPTKEHAKLKLREQYKNPACFERRMLGLCYSSGQKETALAGTLAPQLSSGADFYGLAAAVRRVVSLVTRTEPELEPIAAKSKALLAWMHPFRAAAIFVNKVQIGVIAEAQQGALVDIKRRAVFAEIDLELLLEADQAPRHFHGLPKYPDSFFEMSVVMPEKMAYRELEQLVSANVKAELLRGLEVVAVYQGKPLKDGEKSISVRLSLGANDRTLSGEELEVIQSGLIAAVGKSEFSLRS